MPASTTRTRARTGYTLVVVGLAHNDPIVCIDCIRCGVTIMEASPETMSHDSAWLPKALTMHERTHDERNVVVEFLR